MQPSRLPAWFLATTLLKSPTTPGALVATPDTSWPTKPCGNRCVSAFDRMPTQLAFGLVPPDSAKAAPIGMKSEARPNATTKDAMRLITATWGFEVNRPPLSSRGCARVNRPCAGGKEARDALKTGVALYRDRGRAAFARLPSAPVAWPSG